MSNFTFILMCMLVASVRLTSTFLLEEDYCPVSSPCTCSKSGSYFYIRCDNKDLIGIPHVKQGHTQSSTLYLYFNSNKLTIIADNSFRNFSSFNASDIDLLLHRNTIHTIESNAFKGIEKATRKLSLKYNNLSSIPLAIRNLVNLRALDVIGNSLYSLDASVMSNIGRSLASFSLDLIYFTEWPKELHYLQALQELEVIYIAFSHLDVNVFHGFENSLTSLRLEFSKLEKVPYAICHLSNLTEFSFSFNNGVEENKSSIFEPCGSIMSSETSLHLKYNNLNSFPDVFTLFPSLTTLDLAGNHLQLIEISKIPDLSILTIINLQDNRLARIPFALNKFKNLKELNIMNNNIKTIETLDLIGLRSLQYLGISHNPIMYIAPTAFEYNVNLQSIALDDTYLDHVPVTLTSLTKLFDLSLDGLSIDCTCDMSYLKHWNVSVVKHFKGSCASLHVDIKSFISNSLQSCP